MKTESRGLWLIYVIAPLLAACSLLYELLIAQTLSILAANTVVWYSLTVGTYLGAMGLGALIFGSRGRASAWDSLVNVELLLSLVGGLAVLLIHVAHTANLYCDQNDLQVQGILLFFGAAFVVVGLVGFLTGIELPLLIRLGNELSTGRTVTNRVLGLDYIGALIAGVAFPLVLLPRLEVFRVGLATALVNWSIASLILLSFVAGQRRIAAKLVVSLALGGLLVLGLTQWRPVQQYFLQRYYYYFESSDSLLELFGPMHDRRDVLRVSSPYQKIDIVHDDDRTIVDEMMSAYSTKFSTYPDVPKDHFLFLNGDFQVGSNNEEIYHEYFAHVPVLLSERVPRRVLILGGGDGLLARELVKYPEIEEIVQVDLDATLIEMARTHPFLKAMNRGALEDPRVQLRIGDAYQYLRSVSTQFDAIYLDFPYAVDYNLSKLYSREFFHFVRERLSPDGYAVLDAVRVAMFTPADERNHRTLLPRSEWRYHYNSLRSAGFAEILPYVTTLEADNPEARRIAASVLRDELDEGERLEPEDVDEMLLEAVHAMEQAFITMWKTPRAFRRDYWNLGIELHVLDAKRFGLAFTPFPTTPEIQTEWVNSIMRPTLPAIPMWHIRTAW